MAEAGPDFDDYLDLGGQRLAGVRALVLIGRSGAGKTRYLRWLVSHHPDVRALDAAGTLATVDEMWRLRDLPRLWRVVRSASLTLVASHLPGPAHAPIRALGPLRLFHLDRHPDKVARELTRRGVAHSPAAVDAFCGRFGGSYTDLDLVLGRYPGVPFDRAWARFTRECRVRSRRVDAARPRVVGPEAPTRRPRIPATNRAGR